MNGISMLVHADSVLMDWLRDGSQPASAVAANFCHVFGCEVGVTRSGPGAVVDLYAQRRMAIMVAPLDFEKPKAGYSWRFGWATPAGWQWDHSSRTLVGAVRKVYVASGLDNHERVREVLAGLRHHGVVATYDWTQHGPVWRDGEERCREVAVAELGGVAAADAVVVLLPGGRGTHAELGAALVTGRPVFLWAETDHGHLEVSERTCSFYTHPRVTRAVTPYSELLTHLATWLDTVGDSK